MISSSSKKEEKKTEEKKESKEVAEFDMDNELPSVEQRAVDQILSKAVTDTTDIDKFKRIEKESIREACRMGVIVDDVIKAYATDPALAIGAIEKRMKALKQVGDSINQRQQAQIQEIDGYKKRMFEKIVSAIVDTLRAAFHEKNLATDMQHEILELIKIKLEAVEVDIQ
ncbi:hypothetical protein KY315_04115 [Candidatus Woesearchaeota archaeon]|nr:hypothetical protein [Candidatus Woesearchaeota archaeon]